MRSGNRSNNGPGAIAKATGIRAAYIAQPNHCQFCGQAILPRPGEKLQRVRCRKYCNRSCAVSANNTATPKRRRTRRCCAVCGTECVGTLCRTCFYDQIRTIGQKTRGEVTRQAITKHAHAVMNGQKTQCRVCGYDLHAEICHRRAVASFPPDTLVSSINALSNLVYLCPNHHWELDHGRLHLVVAGDGVEPS